MSSLPVQKSAARLVLALGLALASGVHADIGDPTRPSRYLQSGGASSAVTEIAEPTEVSGVATVVTSILVSDKRRMAVVNGASVQIGDSVGSASVVEILPHAVILEGAEGPIELRVAAGPVKVAVSQHESAEP